MQRNSILILTRYRNVVKHRRNRIFFFLHIYNIRIFNLKCIGNDGMWKHENEKIKSCQIIASWLHWTKNGASLNTILWWEWPKKRGWIRHTMHCKLKQIFMFIEQNPRCGKIGKRLRTALKAVEMKIYSLQRERRGGEKKKWMWMRFDRLQCNNSEWYHVMLFKVFLALFRK